VLLSKAEGERLGMHIKGGLNGQRGNPADPSDEGVFVSKINSVGAARRDGRLKVTYCCCLGRRPPFVVWGKLDLNFGSTSSDSIPGGHASAGG